MKKNGFVISSDEKSAKIRINRESSCGGNCAHCKGCGTDEVIFEIENTEGLKAGEIVKVTMEDSAFLKKSFIGYGILVFLIISGAVLGFLLFKNDLISLLFAIVFLIAGLIILKKLFKEKYADIKVERF